MNCARILRISGQGVVTYENEHAQEALGKCVGRKCHMVVAGREYCQAGCVALLLEKNKGQVLGEGQRHPDSDAANP